MKSMTLLVRGSMGSLTALAFAIVTAFSCGVAAAQPPQRNPDGWNLPRAGARPPAPPPGNGPQSGKAEPPVPRGDLRADITDNARQRAVPPRAEAPSPPRR